MSVDSVYCYPGTEVLRNKLGIADAEALDAMERTLVIQRFRETLPTGKFDLKHLRAIHKHLFQDVYEWAGEIRTLEISKGGSTFMFCRFIENGMADVHRRIEDANYLRGLDGDTFAQKAGEIIGDINHIHPFREGNGRSQLTYLRLLAEQAGHRIDVRRIDGSRWHNASRAAHMGDYAPMAGEIRSAIDA